MTAMSIQPLNSTYTFSSQPKVLKEQGRPKFRPPVGHSTSVPFYPFLPSSLADVLLAMEEI